MTGMTRHAFTLLQDVLFFGQQPQRIGRPKLMNPTAQLGLFLFFTGSTMGYKHLCLFFGCTPAVCIRVLNKMLKLVAKKLKRHPLACIRLPNAEQLEYYAQLIHEREPAVDDVIGFMDGVPLTSECTSKPVVQNLMYSGYHSDTMVNNLFAYGPDGRVIFHAINFPRSWHDGSIMANVCKKIDTYKMCIDQGLPRSGDALDVLVEPISHAQAY
jgi:hypothetical protein